MNLPLRTVFGRLHPLYCTLFLIFFSSYKPLLKKFLKWPSLFKYPCSLSHLGRENWGQNYLPNDLDLRINVYPSVMFTISFTVFLHIMTKRRSGAYKKTESAAKTRKRRKKEQNNLQYHFDTATAATISTNTASQPTFIIRYVNHFGRIKWPIDRKRSGVRLMNIWLINSHISLNCYSRKTIILKYKNTQNSYTLGDFKHLQTIMLFHVFLQVLVKRKLVYFNVMHILVYF